MSNRNLIAEQIKICQKFGAAFTPCESENKLGISKDTFSSHEPINGLRHPPANDSCGWYLWSGEVLTSAPDFFQPIHLKHLQNRCPEVLPYLGLPPGYRFLIAKDYVDVWYDESLVSI